MAYQNSKENNPSELYVQTEHVEESFEASRDSVEIIELRSQRPMGGTGDVEKSSKDHEVEAKVSLTFFSK